MKGSIIKPQIHAPNLLQEDKMSPDLTEITTCQGSAIWNYKLMHKICCFATGVTFYLVLTVFRVVLIISFYMWDIDHTSVDNLAPM